MSSNVSIPPSLLSKLDLDAIEVREEFAPDAIAAVLEEMRSEDCVHSWRSFAGDGHIGVEAVDALRAWEQQKRPTAFFMYYGVRAGDQRELIGRGDRQRACVLQLSLRGISGHRALSTFASGIAATAFTGVCCCESLRLFVARSGDTR